MNRQQFLLKSLCGLALVSFPEVVLSNTERKKFISRSEGIFSGSTSSSLLDDKRIAFGWEAMQVNRDPKLLSFVNIPLDCNRAFLRLSAAVEVWENVLVKASIANTGIELGAFDIRYAPALTPFDLEIDPIQIPEILKNGVLLTQTEGENPFWIYENGSEMPVNFKPHIFTVHGEQNRLDNFYNVFASMASIQTFGWREGCVLDGLYQLYKKKNSDQALKTLEDHLAMYLPGDDLTHLDAWNRERGNHLGTIEATLPFASLIKVEPHHPVLKHVEEFWNAKRKESGIVTTSSTITAEGCYTVGYPMAVMSVYQKRQEMIKWSIDQIAERHVLSQGNDFYLTYDPVSGKYGMKNWARGTAWYLLGTARVIETLQGLHNMDELIGKFKQDVDKAISYQRSSGLWNCYLHEESVAPDTSGSAGIATAIALGVNCGILPQSYLSASKKTANALLTYLTPDGYLSGVAQDNRGGEELQKGNYRVIAQMGMGLMAQLYAEL